MRYDERNNVQDGRSGVAITLNVNGQARTVDVEPDTPLLWVLRDTLGLTGTKFGCGIAACGACTVHVDGRAVRTCTVPVSAVEGMAVTTIEGLAADGRLHAVQQAWVDHQVPQCGYCQSGMIMAVSALLAQRPDPSDANIDAAVTNICRCGTFVRVRRAIHAVAKGSAFTRGDAAAEGDTVASREAVTSSGAVADGEAVANRRAATDGEAVANGEGVAIAEAGTSGEAAADGYAVVHGGVVAEDGEEARHG